MSGIIKIDVNGLDEIIAIWLGQLFKNEAEEAKGAADNEEIFALGSDDESALQHKEHANINRKYAEILTEAYEEIKKYWK